MSREEWGQTTWRAAPRLDVPGLVPCAVQCAIVDWDPLPRFRQALRPTPAALAADADPEKRNLAAAARLEVAWSSLFREVTGDRMLLLTDYGRPPEPSDAGGPAASTIERMYVVVSINDNGGKRWLVSTVVRAKEKRLVWAVPFEARRGRTAELHLSEASAMDLTSLEPPTSGGTP